MLCLCITLVKKYGTLSSMTVNSHEKWPSWLIGGLIPTVIALFFGSGKFIVVSFLIGAIIGILFDYAKSKRIWENWPYWLRGGVIGGGVALIFVAFWYFCAFYASEEGSAFFCLGFFFLTPASFPAIQLVNFIGRILSINPSALIEVVFSYAPVINILIWFLFGACVANFIRYFRPKEKARLNEEASS